MNGRLAMVAIALALFALVGCGGGNDDPPPTPSPPPGNVEDEGRPITDEQAVVLARVLQQNWERGGAAFTGEVEVAGVAIPMRGRVDFRSGRGTATLREPSAASRRYVWTRRAVYAQAEPGSRRYEVQPPDAENDPVHAAIALINLLSAETIDNTANIKDQGARFLRSETLDGTPVDVYRLRPDGATTYWIGHDDGLLRQVQARFPNGGRVVVTLTSHEAVRVALPQISR
jgi:hypothetical protein